ncbi:MAG: alanine racemase [Gemmatimonadetes bacterium]|nr:alanine racemase [Gemmatimonadota bacterium]
MTQPRTLDDLTTPAAVIDADRVARNLERMARYTRANGLGLRPHIKTHKTRELAAEQIRLGAVGVTCATLREAEVMSSVADDILIAYPPVGRARLERLCALPDHVRVTVSLDSLEALCMLADAAHAAGREFDVLVELDVGMRRVGLARPQDVVALANEAGARPGVRFRGLMFYPGHIRQPVAEQDDAIAQLAADVRTHVHALNLAGQQAEVVSGGSTPAAMASHHLREVTEIRPGTYIFNDRTTAEIDACDWDDCAYTILATVVSTAVPGQVVVDAGSKAINREELRAPDARGYGALLDRPAIVIRSMSEEHGILDLSASDWKPRIGDRVRIVPNHVCVSVNLHPVLWAVRGDEITAHYEVAARGWA